MADEGASKNSDEFHDLRVTGSFKIGRSPHCNVILNDSHVSKVHCSLNVINSPSASGYQVAITDHSSNGTWLSSKTNREVRKLEKGKLTLLQDDDVILLVRCTPTTPNIAYKYLLSPFPRIVTCSDEPERAADEGCLNFNVVTSQQVFGGQDNKLACSSTNEQKLGEAVESVVDVNHKRNSTKELRRISDSTEIGAVESNSCGDSKKIDLSIGNTKYASHHGVTKSDNSGDVSLLESDEVNVSRSEFARDKVSSSDTSATRKERVQIYLSTDKEETKPLTPGECVEQPAERTTSLKRTSEDFKKAVTIKKVRFDLHPELSLDHQTSFVSSSEANNPLIDSESLAGDLVEHPSDPVTSSGHCGQCTHCAKWIPLITLSLHEAFCEGPSLEAGSQDHVTLTSLPCVETVTCREDTDQETEGSVSSSTKDEGDLNADQETKKHCASGIMQDNTDDAPERVDDGTCTDRSLPETSRSLEKVSSEFQEPGTLVRDGSCTDRILHTPEIPHILLKSSPELQHTGTSAEDGACTDGRLQAPETSHSLLNASPELQEPGTSFKNGTCTNGRVQTPETSHSLLTSSPELQEPGTSFEDGSCIDRRLQTSVTSHGLFKSSPKFQEPVTSALTSYKSDKVEDDSKISSSEEQHCETLDSVPRDVLCSSSQHDSDGQHKLVKEESKERCTYCSKVLPVAELFGHVSECSVRSAAVLSASDSDDEEYMHESCPHCGKDFDIVSLVEHVEHCRSIVMTGEGARTGDLSVHSLASRSEAGILTGVKDPDCVANSEDSSASDKELCPNCRGEFLLSELINHAVKCKGEPLTISSTSHSSIDKPVISRGDDREDVHGGGGGDDDDDVVDKKKENDKANSTQDLNGNSPASLSEAGILSGIKDHSPSDKELCPNCGGEFLLSELINHAADCKRELLTIVTTSDSSIHEPLISRGDDHEVVHDDGGGGDDDDVIDNEKEDENADSTQDVNEDCDDDVSEENDDGDDDDEDDDDGDNNVSDDDDDDNKVSGDVDKDGASNNDDEGEEDDRSVVNTDEDSNGSLDICSEDGEGAGDESDDNEICPKCHKLFNLSQLIEHAASCNNHAGNSKAEVDKSVGTSPETPGPQAVVYIDCHSCGIRLPVAMMARHYPKCGAKHGALTTKANSTETASTKNEDIPAWLTARVDAIDNLSKRTAPDNEKERSGPLASGVYDLAASPVSAFREDYKEYHGGFAECKGGLKRMASSLDSYHECEEQCMYCLKMFAVSVLVEHASVCAVTKQLPAADDLEQCCHCLQNFPLSELIDHAQNCEHRPSHDSQDSSQGDVINSQSSCGEPLERCMYCFRDFPVSKLIRHSQRCDGDMSGPRERFSGFLPSVHDLSAVSSVAILNDSQRAALEYVISHSAQDSKKVYSALLARVQHLGYSENDLTKTLQWVRSASPIIIHVNLDRAINFLLEDTHYRNRFETGTSGGSMDMAARKSWEDRIFNRSYKDSSPSERVKYGVLNIVGDPRGVRSCLPYGDSFLQLKKVRLRTTFASMDTSGTGVKLSCCEHYGNVLYEYTEQEIAAIMDVATGKVPFHRSDCISNYKEVQIHGPVSLSENVECIVVNSRHQGDTRVVAQLDRFVEQNSCNLIWMDPDDLAGPTPASFGAAGHYSHAASLPRLPVGPYYRSRSRPKKRRRR